MESLFDLRSDLYCGEALAVLRTLPDCSVDSVVTDPPYGLSKPGGFQGAADRVFRVLVKIGLPDLYEWDAKFAESVSLARVGIKAATLTGKNGAVGKGPRIRMPKSAIDLQGDLSGKKEVGAGDVATILTANAELSTEADSEKSQFLGDFVLDLGDMPFVDHSRNVGAGCMAEVFPRGFAVMVLSKATTCFPGLTRCGLPIVFGDEHIRDLDDSLCEPKFSPEVVALPGAVNAIMLRFDGGGRPLELLATYRALNGDGCIEFRCPQLVRALAPASSLSTVAEPHRVRFVFPSADGACSEFWIHVWMPRDYSVGVIIPSGGFMGKSWDSVLPDKEIWRECFRVMRPGSYLLAFGGTRTFHRLACDLEDVGFALQDTLCWLFGSGFPKHKSKLKPAWEPIIMAWKPDKKATPLPGLDACRIDGDVPVTTQGASSRIYGDGNGLCPNGSRESVPHPKGRWPANIVLDEAAAAMLDEQAGVLSGTNCTRSKEGHFGEHGGLGKAGDEQTTYGDTGGASRFFFVAKASKRDREGGLDEVEPSRGSTEVSDAGRREGVGADRMPMRRNTHPTVKPIALMRYLCRLITPPGATVLGCFMGSGTTGIAAALEGFGFIGIEREREYVDIAERRIAYWKATVTK